MKTSIILPTYCPTPEVEEYLKNCLEALAAHSTSECEVVVVENGSESPLLHSRMCDTFVRTRQPLGYAKAVNIGVKLARAEYLLIVNNDLFVEQNWDTELCEAYERLPGGGGVLGAVETHLTSPGVKEFWMDASWWSCVCIRRDVWDKVGPLDDGPLNYRLHDQDWSIRAKLAGYDVARWTGARVRHVNSATYKHMETHHIETSERAEMRRRHGHEHFVDWLREEWPDYANLDGRSRSELQSIKYAGRENV